MPFYTDPDPAFHVDKTEENFLKLPFYLAILADPETIIRIRIIRIRIIRIRIIRTDPGRTKLEKNLRIRKNRTDPGKSCGSGKLVQILKNRTDPEKSYGYN